MRILKIVLALILAIGLVAGSTLTVIAKEEKEKLEVKNKVPAEMQRGEVISVDAVAGSFVMKNGGKELTITTDNNTRYFKMAIPAKAIGVLRNRLELKEKEPKEPKLNSGVGIGGQIQVVRKGGNAATFNDISVGDKVAVQLQKGTNLAKLVIIFEPLANTTVKVPDTFANIKGKVSALDTTKRTIEITSTNGTAALLNYGDQTVFTLRGVTAVAVGQTAHAVYRVKDMMARSVNIQPVPIPITTAKPTTST